MKKPIIDEQKIEELLSRGVEEVIEKTSLEKKLKSGKVLRVKLGIDPTGSDLHLGHLVVLRKMKQFQDLGHQVILLIGDYTGMIGDPSGRSETRKMLERKDLKKNEATYLDQASKVLDIKKVELRHNSEWYDKKGPAFLMELTSKFTFARLIERDDFKKRIAQDIDVSMLELLYPLLQGYDSVALKADVELGGTDQKFNLLMGRKVQKRYDLPEQDVVTVPLLEGLDGVRKMSKSYGNYIAFNDSPQEMFGKIMSLPDTLLIKYFKLATYLSLVEIEDIQKKIRISSLNPKNVKILLAKEVVKIFYKDKDADKAEVEFNKMFRDKERPTDIPKVKIEKKDWPVVDLLVQLELAASKAEAQRLVEQGGVKVNDVAISDWRQIVAIKTKDVVQVGKRKFIEII